MHEKSDLRVSVVNSILISNDAISNCARYKSLALQNSTLLGREIIAKTYCFQNKFSDVDAIEVRSVSDLVLDDEFLASDVVVYEFGIFHELFNSVFLLPSSTVTVGNFHNITPPHLAKGSEQAVLQKSIVQMANLCHLDHVLCDSEFNLRDLIEYGVERDRMSVLYPPVDLLTDPKGGLSPHNHAHNGLVDEQRSEHLPLLYVGRFVKPKGVKDLLQAVQILLQRGYHELRLTLAGNLAFSDALYVDALKREIESTCLKKHVNFLGTVDDATLAKLYSQAEVFTMPSHHEGFCVPVLEAYSNGCFVIATDAGNLPYLMGDNGVTVPTGDVAALADAIQSYCDARRENRLSQSSLLELALEQERAPIDGVDLVPSNASPTSAIQRSELHFTTNGGRVSEQNYRQAVREYASKFSVANYQREFLNSLERLLLARGHESYALTEKELPLGSDQLQYSSEAAA